ncbi:Gfo/Idh/MocA family oxidoreductase [Bacteroides cellulosilyticus]|jgi:predicted dehydrogenase|uniref:Gfo/Idh/MocA family oxidoreductase n=1 Tax=Bacteroides cellulosilyticus TaxID=246787 RepID=UPI0018A0603B|nr:Gfo/Idh/MocA family oxidoreductase [Bacteroides cellulosilyticus]
MENIWLIGAGAIAVEYAKVLNALKKDFITIGRGHVKAEQFFEKTGNKVIEGGLDKYIDICPRVPEYAIVAVNVQYLASTTISLMKYGVKNIFCEKPGFNNPSELDEVIGVAKKTEANVYYAYNRRFFTSVFEAEKIIKEDGGMTSINFEFTEWSHVIESISQPAEVKKNWLTANSSHVIDLAFFLAGAPVQMQSYTFGELSWHKPACFVGAGITTKGVLFNYQANWNAPGRWAVEIQTALHRIYLKPMEQLQLQDKGSVKVYPVEIDDHLDKEFKPGFYLETEAFLSKNTTKLCSIKEQANHVKCIYNKIMGK